MTGFVTCRWCGTRVLSDKALTEHQSRCKLRPSWDDHVNTALTIGAES